MPMKRTLCLVPEINHRWYYLIWCVKFYILVKIWFHVGVELGFVCYPLFPVFFCYPFPSGLHASLSRVRSFLSNKPSCRISVFFLAFQNVKIVKLLNVTKMKLLGMKFLWKNHSICGILQSIPKENSWIRSTYFLKKEAAPLIVLMSI